MDRYYGPANKAPRRWGFLRVSAAPIFALALLALGMAFVGGATVTAQSSGTLTVRPSKTTVGVGETFTIDVMQTADFPTLGGQGTVYFDPAVLTLVLAEPGPAYADASFSVPLYTVEEAVANSNSSGKFEGITTFFFPGTASVPPGETAWIHLTFKGRGGGSTQVTVAEREYSGTSPFSGAPVSGLEPVGLLPDPPDAFGSLTPVTVVPAQITVSGDAPAPGATTPAASGSGSATPKPSRTTAAGSRTPTGSGSPDDGPTAFINPTESEVAKGGTFSIEVMARMDTEVTGAAIDLVFDREVATVESVEAGEEWTASANTTYEDQITAANSSGELTSLVLTRRPSDDPIEAGEVSLFTITFNAADKDADSDLTVENAVLIDANGEELRIEDPFVGSVIVGEGGSDGGGGMGTVLMIFGGVIALGLIGGGGAFAYQSMKKRRWDE